MNDKFLKHNNIGWTEKNKKVILLLAKRYPDKIFLCPNNECGNMFFIKTEMQPHYTFENDYYRRHKTCKYCGYSSCGTPFDMWKSLTERYIIKYFKITAANAISTESLIDYIYGHTNLWREDCYKRFKRDAQRI